MTTSSDRISGVHLPKLAWRKVDEQDGGPIWMAFAHGYAFRVMKQINVSALSAQFRERGWIWRWDVYDNGEGEQLGQWIAGTGAGLQRGSDDACHLLAAEWLQRRIEQYVKERDRFQPELAADEWRHGGWFRFPDNPYVEPTQPLPVFACVMEDGMQLTVGRHAESQGRSLWWARATDPQGSYIDGSASALIDDRWGAISTIHQWWCGWISQQRGDADG